MSDVHALDHPRRFLQPKEFAKANQSLAGIDLEDECQRRGPLSIDYWKRSAIYWKNQFARFARAEIRCDCRNHRDGRSRTAGWNRIARENRAMQDQCIRPLRSQERLPRDGSGRDGSERNALDDGRLRSCAALLSGAAIDDGGGRRSRDRRARGVDRARPRWARPGCGSVGEYSRDGHGVEHSRFCRRWKSGAETNGDDHRRSSGARHLRMRRRPRTCHRASIRSRVRPDDATAREVGRR